MGMLANYIPKINKLKKTISLVVIQKFISQQNNLNLILVLSSFITNQKDLL
jgi:hypothetical protein